MCRLDTRLSAGAHALPRSPRSKCHRLHGLSIRTRQPQHRPTLRNLCVGRPGAFRRLLTEIPRPHHGSTRPEACPRATPWPRTRGRRRRWWTRSQRRRGRGTLPRSSAWSQMVGLMRGTSCPLFLGRLLRNGRAVVGLAILNPTCLADRGRAIVNVYRHGWCRSRLTLELEICSEARPGMSLRGSHDRYAGM